MQCILRRSLGCTVMRQKVGPIETVISQKLTQNFSPEVLAIQNESGKHGFREFSLNIAPFYYNHLIEAIFKNCCS